jgi:Cu-Zn family superoxide dismutase
MSSHCKRAWLAAGVAGGLALAVGCQSGSETNVQTTTRPSGASGPAHPTPTAPAPTPTSVAMPTATATIAGLSGNTASGTVTFRDTGNGVAVEAHLSGLAPGKHGFHIHENGDCSGDGTAAGAHFNPMAQMHGGPDAPVHHGGDLGNLTVNADGTGMVTMTLRGLSLGTGPDSIVGRSVLVHEKEDDLATDPSGNSGARIACGVITLDSGAAAGGAAGSTGETAPSGTSGGTGASGASAPSGSSGATH